MIEGCSNFLKTTRQINTIQNQSWISLWSCLHCSTFRPQECPSTVCCVACFFYYFSQCDISDVAKRSCSIIASCSAYCIALVPGHYCINRRCRIRKHIPPVPARLSTAPWTFHSTSPSAAETPPHTTIHHIHKSISCTLCHSHKTAAPPWSSQKGRWNIRYIQELLWSAVYLHFEL